MFAIDNVRKRIIGLNNQLRRKKINFTSLEMHYCTNKHDKYLSIIIIIAYICIL